MLARRLLLKGVLPQPLGHGEGKERQGRMKTDVTTDLFWETGTGKVLRVTTSQLPNAHTDLKQCGPEANVREVSILRKTSAATGVGHQENTHKEPHRT